MSFLAEQTILEQHLAANAGLLPAGLGIGYANDGQNFTEPHIRLLVNDGPQEQVSLGAQTNFYRNDGIAVIEIKHSLEIGAAQAMQIADTLATMFRSQQFPGLITLAPFPNRLGERNGWYQVNVLIPFRSTVLY